MEMITSLDFPERRDLSTVLYPRVYLPDLSVEWSEWGIHVSARVRQRGSNVDAVAMGRRRRRRVAGKKRHASAPHDNLEAVVDAVALLALLLALGRLGGGGGGGGVSAHRRWVLYSLLKRVKRRCCCTKRALRTECGMQKGRRCGRTRVLRLFAVGGRKKCTCGRGVALARSLPPVRIQFRERNIRSNGARPLKLKADTCQVL